MKIELFDVDEFCDLNHLQQVTSPVLFERGGVPNDNGLISNKIFGVNVKSRKQTFAYIELNGQFFHPHIYKAMKRIFRNVEKIISGEEYYIIDKDGHLVKDMMNGETGIDFLYNNWEKIKWEKSEEQGMRNERIDLITKTKKNIVFIHRQIVIPAFYRDIKSNQSGGGETNELNNLYTKLIRLSSVINEKDMFDFSFHTTNLNIQNTLVDIYDEFKNKLDKKNGMLRKYLMGKNTDYTVRTVISAPTFHANSVEDMQIDFKHGGIPLSQICVLCYPFILAWLRNFFERELILNKSIKFDYNDITGESDKFVTLDNPESYFNDTYLKKAVDKFVKDPSSRYDLIEVPTTSPHKRYLRLTGKTFNGNTEGSTIIDRYMTWTDLIFLACSDVVKDKHMMVTRYPLLDYFGVFLSRIRVLSTLTTTPVMINGQVYKWYPNIDLNMTKEQVSNNFIDTLVFSNSYLAGLDGDYDGDQVTVKIFWTQEANEECEKIINSKSYILNINGDNIRKTDNEAIQTLYVLTKEPIKK